MTGYARRRVVDRAGGDGTAAASPAATSGSGRAATRRRGRPALALGCRHRRPGDQLDACGGDRALHRPAARRRRPLRGPVAVRRDRPAGGVGRRLGPTPRVRRGGRPVRCRPGRSGTAWSRVELLADSSNEPAQRLALAAGFRREGQLRGGTAGRPDPDGRDRLRPAGHGLGAARPARAAGRRRAVRRGGRRCGRVRPGDEDALLDERLDPESRRWATSTRLWTAPDVRVFVAGAAAAWLAGTEARFAIVETRDRRLRRLARAADDRARLPDRRDRLRPARRLAGPRPGHPLRAAGRRTGRSPGPASPGSSSARRWPTARPGGWRSGPASSSRASPGCGCRPRTAAAPTRPASA